jgi:hypothetical protein
MATCTVVPNPEAGLSLACRTRAWPAGPRAGSARRASPGRTGRGRGGRCCRSGARQVLLLQASAAEWIGQHHPMIGQEGEQVLPIVAGDHHTRPAGGWCCRSAHSMSGRSLPSPTAAPGIPAAERVLESVVLLERSRSPRSGLGLSLVDAVERLHHARLILEHNTPPARAAASSSRRRSDRQLGRGSFEHRGCRRPESRRPRPSRPRPRQSPPSRRRRLSRPPASLPAPSSRSTPS